MIIKRILGEEKNKHTEAEWNFALFFKKTAFFSFYGTINSISVPGHCRFPNITFVICLIGILGYSSTALSGGSSKGKLKPATPSYQTTKIPKNIQSIVQQKLLNPGTDLKANRNKPIVPEHSSPAINPNATQFQLAREPEKPPVKEKEKEASHSHAHHQPQPCDKENSKQVCQE